MLHPVSANPETDSKLSYSQGIVVHGELRTLYISGQIGVDPAGKIAPEFEAQARQAWVNLVEVLKAAKMSVSDLVKVSAFITDPGDYAAYAKVRGEFISGHKPASTLLVVAALARPEWKVEIEAIAAVAKNVSA